MATGETRVCKGCGEELDIDEFRSIYMGEGKYLRQGKCKKCLQNYQYRRRSGGIKNRMLSRAQLAELFADTDED